MDSLIDEIETRAKGVPPLITAYLHLSDARRRIYLRERRESGKIDIRVSSLWPYVAFYDSDGIGVHITIPDCKSSLLQGFKYHHWEIAGGFGIPQELADELNAKKIPHPIDVFEELGT